MFPRVGLETRAETMSKILSFYVYCLAVFPIVDFFDLISDPRPAVIVRIIVEIIVAYVVIRGYRVGYYQRLRIGSALYGLAAVGTLLVAAMLGMLPFYGLAAFEIVGCYMLGFSAEARALILEIGTNSNNKNAIHEFEESVDYTEYKGHSIRKSRNYYWVGERRFSDIKKAEAYIQNEL